MKNKANKKPSLTLVRPDVTSDKLSATSPGAKLMKTITDQWDLNPAEAELLAQVCSTLNEIGRLERIVGAEGLMVQRRDGSAPHPALRIIQAKRQFVAKAMRDLGLLEPEQKRPLGRPPSAALGVTMEDED